MRAFDFACRQLWTILLDIEPDGAVYSSRLEQILDISARRHEPNFEAVALKLADKASDSGVLEMRDGVAVVNITGPILRYADIFTQISGATSVQEIGTAFRAAMDDPAAKAVILNVDSPGGAAAGIGELSSAIHDARGGKPIVAYVDDMAASGAYWLAAAADRIVMPDAGSVGSIGAVANLTIRGAREGTKSYQFVSSASPMKRPDLETDAGRAELQRQVDDLAAVFVSAVAKGRGVTTDKVLSDFGQGGMLIASKAIAAGMADELGSFEGLVSSLSASKSTFSFGETAKFTKGAPMETPNSAAPAAAQPIPTPAAPPAAPAVTADAGKLERDRIAGILACEEAKGRESLANHIAFSTAMTVDEAKKLLAASPAAQAATANPLAAAMANPANANPTVGIGATNGASDAEEATLIAGALKHVRKTAKGAN